MDGIFCCKKGYHIRYCDLPNSTNPKYTCAQLGYRIRGVKEEAEDSSLSQDLYHCYQRIDKGWSRGAITAEERKALREKAQEIYRVARTKPSMFYEAFNTSLSNKKLYPLCAVQ